MLIIEKQHLEFDAKFKLPMRDTPGFPTAKQVNYDYICFSEEAKEMVEAFEQHDLAGYYDALIDLQYFLTGAFTRAKLPIEPGFTEVHRANMSKERADEYGINSKRGSSLDVIKPVGWQPPDMVKVVADIIYEDYRCSTQKD